MIYKFFFKKKTNQISQIMKSQAPTIRKLNNNSTSKSKKETTNTHPTFAAINDRSIHHRLNLAASTTNQRTQHVNVAATRRSNKPSTGSLHPYDAVAANLTPPTRP